MTTAAACQNSSALTRIARVKLAVILGSSAVMLGSTGIQQWRQKYYPFGLTCWGIDTAPTDKRFTGHQREGDLYYMRARFYDPAVGRFLQPDSVVPDYADPQSLNRYSGACPDRSRRACPEPSRRGPDYAERTALPLRRRGRTADSL